jgi:hypothetical protein
MKASPYQSLLVMVTGFLVLAYVFPDGAFYWNTAALIVGLLGLISSITRRAILWVWNGLSLVLGWINSRIILSVVFIFFLAPIGFLYKLFKGDLMSLKRPPADSLFVNRDHTFTTKDLENPW